MTDESYNATGSCPNFYCNEDCWGDADLTSHCWTIQISQLVAGVACVVHASLLIPQGYSLINLWKYVARRWNKYTTVPNARKPPSKPPQGVFVTYQRTEANFCLNNEDPKLVIPPTYQSEYEPLDLLPSEGEQPCLSFRVCKDFVGGFLAMDGGTIFVVSIGWALIASSMATVLWLGLYYEEAIPQCSGSASGEFILIYSLEAQAVSQAFYSSFVFFPTFLLAGYLSYVAYRWRDFLINCHTIQAKIHNVSLCCGMSITRPVTMPARKRLYKIYRYLSTIHALTYQSVSDSLRPLTLSQNDGENPMNSFVGLGLLTPQEVRVLLPMDNKIRDTVLTWLGGEVNELLLHHSQHRASDITIYLVCELRGVCGRHHDLFVRDNPNSYVRLLLVVVMLWLITFVVTSPWRMLTYAGVSEALFAGPTCFQPYVLFANAVMILTITSCVSLVRLLRNPFALTVERIKVDNLIASTDRTIFASLRGLFDDRDEPEGDHHSIHNHYEESEAGMNGVGNRKSYGNTNHDEEIPEGYPEPEEAPHPHGRPSMRAESYPEHEEIQHLFSRPSMRTGPRNRTSISKYTSLRDVREI